MDSDSNKKPKLISNMFLPFAPSGAVAASRSSMLTSDESLAKVHLQRVENDDLFFPDGMTSDLATIDIGKKVRDALRGKGVSENALRNSIYTDLKQNHGIQFPASAQQESFERTLRAVLKRNERYLETNLANLLKEFYECSLENDPPADMTLERILRGLIVTTTSLPDMTVVRDQSLVFGEFKNDLKYSLEHAQKQCALYLFALLYAFRVRLGLPVRAVFGFWLCGRRCSDQNNYSMGFIRLSAPNALGRSIVPEYVSKTYSVDDVTGIQSLVRFLKDGKNIEWYDERHKLPVDPQYRIPALFTLPCDLWMANCVVKNGTTSMVLKGTGKEISKLLSSVDLVSSYRYERTFLSAALSFLASRVDKTFYLKIRLKDVTPWETPEVVIENLLERAKDVFDELYCVSPYISESVGIYLMKDCGVPLNSSESFRSLSYAEYLGCFADLWDYVLDLAEFYLHGDALPHNVLYDVTKSKLCLIDLDEGRHKFRAPRRVVEGTDDGFEFLRYPNYLRHWAHRRRYTQLQLTALFLLAFSLLNNPQCTGADVATMSDLRTKATVANSYLMSRDNSDPEKAGPIFGKSVDGLIEAMEEVLKKRGGIQR